MFLSLVSLLLALTGLARGQSRGFCTTVDGQNGQCRPLVKCVRFFHEIPTLQQRPCPLTTGEKGVCCPHIVLGSATCEYLIHNYTSTPLQFKESYLEWPLVNEKEYY